MKENAAISGYKFLGSGHSPSHAYLLPAIKSELIRFAKARPNAEKRLFDLGCGNGSTAAVLAQMGYAVSGVDPSTTGIAQAQANHPDLDLQFGSAYDDLSARFGTFPVVISLEVVEHLYDPKTFATSLFNLLEPGGLALISTPYHGYTKNLVLAVSGKMDGHYNPLWDHGHIKFWSIATLSKLLEKPGLEIENFHRVGRFPALAKSMIAVARKPE